MPTNLSDHANSLENSKLKKIPESKDNIFHYLFPLLSKKEKIIHSVFTRLGGISKAPYNYLNTGYNTGDRHECVRTNLEIIKKSINANRLLYMNQVHGRDILSLRRDHKPDLDSVASVDAMVTDIPGIALMVKQADCQAVILYDPYKKVLANVHCGWRGNCNDILGTVIKRMESQFGSDPAEIMAAIGPSLGPCCAEFITYRDIFPKSFEKFMVKKNHFNLWEISKMQLLNAGMRRENIEFANICTKCNTNLFYSYRAEGITGRFATVAMLID